MGNKRNRNKEELVPVQNVREQAVSQLEAGGFNTALFTEYEIAMLTQVTIAREKIVEAIDELGAMLEDVLAPEEGEG